MSHSGHLILLRQGPAYISITNPQDGSLIKEWGGQGSKPGEFSLPSSVVVDLVGNFLISDSENHRIQFLTPDGVFIKQIGNGTRDLTPGLIADPIGITVDVKGNLIVSEWGSPRIQVFDSTGKSILCFGSSGSGEGEIADVYGISTDKNQNILISDQTNQRIQVFSPEGKFIMMVDTGEPVFPLAVFLNKEGDMIVTTSNKVLIYG